MLKNKPRCRGASRWYLRTCGRHRWLTLNDCCKYKIPRSLITSTMRDPRVTTRHPRTLRCSVQYLNFIRFYLDFMRYFGSTSISRDVGLASRQPQLAPFTARLLHCRLLPHMPMWQLPNLNSLKPFTYIELQGKLAFGKLPNGLGTCRCGYKTALGQLRGLIHEYSSIGWHLRLYALSPRSTGWLRAHAGQGPRATSRPRRSRRRLE